MGHMGKLSRHRGVTSLARTTTHTTSVGVTLNHTLENGMMTIWVIVPCRVNHGIFETTALIPRAASDEMPRKKDTEGLGDKPGKKR